MKDKVAETDYTMAFFVQTLNIFKEDICWVFMKYLALTWSDLLQF